MTANLVRVAVMARVKDDMSQIRKRGNSLQIAVLAGRDPVTGKRLYLTESTTDLAEAKRIRARFRAQVAEQRNARTKATFRHTVEEWLKVHEIEETTRQSYEMYLRLYLGPVLGELPVGKVSPRVLEQFYAQLRRCSRLCDSKPFVEHRIDSTHECRTVKHRRPPGRMPAGGYPPHDCENIGCTIVECQPHRCKPLSGSTILKIHFVISGAMSAAVRWDWIMSNPADVARKPRQPIPQPKPPTGEQAGDIMAAAWEQDEDWGTLVWLVMVTGMRRAEVLGLRWQHLDLPSRTLTVQRNHLRAKGKTYEKDTKTHQDRRISLDEATVEVLVEHRHRYEQLAKSLGSEPTDEAYLFSHEPARDRPYNPDAVSHRYANMCAGIGIDTHLHALRHYSATELIQAGVDLRTVAGRLGHGGGGATTLRVYAAWVGESDRRAAEILGGRMIRPKSTAAESDG
jgi:integrase